MWTWIKPGIWGAVIGSVLTMIVGFSWGGWVRGATAEQLARQEAGAAVTSALVPVCLANAKQDPASEEKVSELRAIQYAWDQREFVIKAGWATLPGSDDPNRQVAEMCASQLLQTADAR